MARCSWRGSGEKGLDTKKKNQGRRLARWRKTFQAWVTSLLPWHLVGLPACSLVTLSLSTMKSVETSEVCSKQARRRERTKEVHILDTTTDRGADLSRHRTGFDKWQISMFPYISAIKEVFLKPTSRSFPFGSCLQGGTIYFLFDGYMNFNKT